MKQIMIFVILFCVVSCNQRPEQGQPSPIVNRWKLNTVDDCNLGFRNMNIDFFSLYTDNDIRGDYTDKEIHMNNGMSYTYIITDNKLILFDPSGCSSVFTF